MPDNGKLFLLDAMALIYRAFYAMAKNPRINSKGMNTGAILGFANTLYEVIQKEKPTHIGVAFDTHAPTFRHESFEGYKAHRQAMPEDLAASIPWIKRLIQAFNIPVLEAEGFEADDIIGTLARKAEARGYEVYMMTSDKDFGQLVTDKVFVYRPSRFSSEAEVLGVKEVCEKFGIQHPEQVIDILGLMGDASDNIPGVPGVGEVTAKALIARYGSVENLFEKAETIEKGKLRDNLINNKEQALASKQLATIYLDVPVEFSEEGLRLVPPDVVGLKALLEELEFRTFAQKVFAADAARDEQKQLSLFAEPAASASPSGFLLNSLSVAHIYVTADTPELHQEVLAALLEAKEFSFDTETTGPDPNHCELVSICFAVKPHHAWFIPLPEAYHEASEILETFRPAFAHPDILKTGQNLKYDLTVLHWYGIEVAPPMFDTMLAHYLIEPEQRHNMDFLSRTYLGYEPIPIETLIGKKGTQQGSMRQVPLETLKEYAAEDADVTLRLKQALEPLLDQTANRELFREIEMPLMPVLVAMETEGVKIDTQALKEFSQELDTGIRQVEQDIYHLSGERFNIASPRQLGVILFEKLKVAENPRLTATKQYATGEDVLEKLAGRHPVIEKILEYRSLTKLKSTYVDTLPGMLNPRTGRIHTSYNQAVTSTGRLSSNNPNLQNIPVRTEKGREIRKAFVPRNADYILLAADYSQIELRIIAHLSGDPVMKDAFRQGLDIHAATASRIYDTPLAEVSREQRRAAKSVNFGIVYGISAFGLSQNLNIARKEAAQIIEAYFAQYPGVKAYMDSSIDFARKHGYVETLKGRRRYLPDIHSANANMRGFAERNAINAPIQGSAADMIKIAMIQVQESFRKYKLQSFMILQVHDELVFDVRQEETETVKEIVSKCMAEALPLSVPVEVDINTGFNWLEAH